MFNVIGKDLGISKDEAYFFWQSLRNGLLHTALPQELESFPYSLRLYGTPIEREGKLFLINPFKMRDHLLDLIEKDLKKWKSHYAHLPVTCVMK